MTINHDKSEKKTCILDEDVPDVFYRFGGLLNCDGMRKNLRPSEEITFRLSQETPEKYARFTNSEWRSPEKS